jgi:Transposase DDE domain
MTNFPQGNPSVPADIEQINPTSVNPRLLKDIANIISPLISMALPPKRSGYTHTAFIIFQACIQLLLLSPHKTAKWLEHTCQEKNISFQRYNVIEFTNKKNRRFFPDQPSLSRYLKWLDLHNNMETFWNMVLIAQLLYLKKIKEIGKDLKLIGDYTKTLCKKNRDDPYCFGTKEGKTCHKTLTFSIISGELHQIIANYKIKKRQDKLPLFEEIVEVLNNEGFNIVYALLDRGFYRKRLLSFLKMQGITVIMPGRKCIQTAQKILKYLMNQEKRYCRGFIKLAYVRNRGFPTLKFDLLLVAKRSYTLTQIKHDLKSTAITLVDAVKRIFPLIVMFGRNGGIKTLHGNENYVRNLYRQRWWIEIAFREMNRLGITDRSQNRTRRLGSMGVKSLLYNIWQVQRHLLKKEDPSSEPLELDEFLGKCYNKRCPSIYGI